MATIVEIMDAMEARLATIPCLNTSDVTPGQITTPAAVVGLPEEIDYLVSFSDTNTELNFSVMVMVAQGLDFEAQKFLAGFMDKSGANSIPAAFAADPKLGGVVDYCTLQRCTRQPINFNGIDYYGAVFTFEVASSGA